MSQIFPQKFDLWLKMAGAGAGLFGLIMVGVVWYYFSPRYIDVGYRPQQPIDYSHKVHAGDLGLDCRYCHVGVEQTASAVVPPTETCMNCHSMILKDSPRLALLHESWNNNKPIEWVRVHDLPDYSYFNHGVHVRAGVGCFSCHGNVAQMEKIMQVETLSMSWCLDCHRNPDPHLRPLDQVANMKWQPSAKQSEFAAWAKKTRQLAPPEDCSRCHY